MGKEQHVATCLTSIYSLKLKLFKDDTKEKKNGLFYPPKGVAIEI